MRTEKSISTDDWIEKYEEKFIQKHNEESTNLDLFHFTVDKLNTLRIRILMNTGLSSFNQSHTKIIDKINKEFESVVRGRLTEILTIKPTNSGKTEIMHKKED